MCCCCCKPRCASCGKKLPLHADDCPEVPGAMVNAPTSRPPHPRAQPPPSTPQPKPKSSGGCYSRKSRCQSCGKKAPSHKSWCTLPAQQLERERAAAAMVEPPPMVQDQSTEVMRRVSDEQCQHRRDEPTHDGPGEQTHPRRSTDYDVPPAYSEGVRTPLQPTYSDDKLAESYVAAAR